MAKLKFKNGLFYVGKKPIEGVYAYNINEDFEKRHNPNLHVTIKAEVAGVEFNDINNLISKSKKDGKIKNYELSSDGEVLYHNDFEGMIETVFTKKQVNAIKFLIKKYSEEKTPQN